MLRARKAVHPEPDEERDHEDASQTAEKDAVLASAALTGPRLMVHSL